jgi:hypothetical protein
MRVIELAAGELAATLDERRGGEIRRFDLAGEPLLASYDWASPVPADHSRSYGDAKLDWLSEYRGGWQLLVPNAGAACTVDGVPLPFHGEWSRTAVDVVEATADRAVLRAGTRLGLVVERRIVVAPDRLTVTTTVENETSDRRPFVWGEHPAFACGPGDRLDLPPGPDETGLERVGRGGTPSLAEVPAARPFQGVHFLPDRHGGWAALRRPHLGVALAWDVTDFPHLWIWHEIGGPELPFFGRASLVAIEPASSWPGDGLAAAIEAGQAHWVDPQARRTTTVTVLPFRPDGRAVVGVEPDGTIQLAAASGER